METTIAKVRWYRLIPVIFITYSLAYLDRANFGFASAGGMAKDLNITSSVSSLLGRVMQREPFYSGPGCHLLDFNLSGFYSCNKSV